MRCEIAIAHTATPAWRPDEPQPPPRLARTRPVTAPVAVAAGSRRPDAGPPAVTPAPAGRSERARGNPAARQGTARGNPAARPGAARRNPAPRSGTARRTPSVRAAGFPRTSRGPFPRSFGRREFARPFPGRIRRAGPAEIVPASNGILPAAAPERFRFRIPAAVPIMFPAARTEPFEAPSDPAASSTGTSPGTSRAKVRRKGPGKAPGTSPGRTRTVRRAGRPRSFSQPSAAVMPRGFHRLPAHPRKASRKASGRAPRVFPGGPLSAPPSLGSRPPGRFPAPALREGLLLPGPLLPGARARSSRGTPRPPGSPTGRYGAPLCGDGDSGAGLLHRIHRTNPQATRLQPRRHKGLKDGWT